MPETLAVYITPPDTDPFYRFATELLGYDLWTQRIAPNERSTCWAGSAANFGFHCTVGDALVFRDGDMEEIRARLEWICSRVRSFTLTDFHLNHDFWAGDQVLVAGFSEESGEIAKLAGLIATIINPLYIDSPYYPALLPRLGEYCGDYYRKYGAPQVLEYYVPHFTLASGIQDKASRKELITLAEHEFFSKNRNYTQKVDRVHLLRKKDNGFYEVTGSYMLGTGK